MSSFDGIRISDNSAFATTLIAALEVRIRDAWRLQRNPNAMASIDRQIRSPELLRLVMCHGDVKTNRSKDTPLILAVKTGDLSLVKYFAEHSANAAAGCKNCEYSEMTATELLSHRNEKRDNPLLVSLSMCLDVGIHPRASPTTSIDTQKEFSYQPDRAFTYLLKLALRECRKSAVFYHTTERRKNMLHIAFGKVCPSCDDFCVARYLLQALTANSVCVDHRQEDHKHFTLLFRLLKRGNKGADLQSKDSDPENIESDEETDILHRQTLLIRELKQYSEEFSVPWEEMLVNSYGMDVAHVCASCNSMQFLMTYLIKEMSPGKGLHLRLYENESAEFDSQIVLSGPIDEFAVDGKTKRPRQVQLQSDSFRYGLWTALHFACDGGHSESMAYLMQRGFSLQDCARNGATCIDIAFAKPDRQEAILCAFQIVSDQSEGRVGPLGRSWVLEYTCCVDSVRSVLDCCNSEHSDGAPTEAAADLELSQAWYLFKKSQKYRGLTSLKEMNAKSLMYMCFENDSATQYRALLHSTFWRRAIENPKSFGFHLSREKIIDETLPDRDFIKFFINVMEELLEIESEVPIKERLGVKVDFMWWTFEGLSLDRRQSNAVSRRPMFSYRDLCKNGAFDDSYRVVN